MERLFLECTVRAALLVGGTVLVLNAMRVKSAAAKHCIWTGVMGLMLVLPIWMAWGPKVSLHLLPPLATVTAGEPISLAGNLPSSFTPSPLISTWKAAFLGIYVMGLCLLLFRLAIGTVRARKLLHSAVQKDSILTSPLCAAPVTIGFLRPEVVLPEHWPQWPQTQLESVLTHESEHARRRDSLVQWLALLNRALFWFHPAAWWLERTLSALAEEACDNIVLRLGHNPKEYAECLINMARSVTRSGTRVNVTGMAMPGSFLSKRIRQIIEGKPTPQISRMRMACVAAACIVTCTAFAAGKLDHAKQSLSAQTALTQANSESGTHSATKYVLGDLKIEGEVHDREGVTDRILKAWKDREYDGAQELADSVMRAGIRADFQERGYFKIVVHDPVSRPLDLTNGKQRMLITTSVEEGSQFRLGTITITSAVAGRSLSFPAKTLREQFHIRDGDVFNMTEIRAGLERLTGFYGDHGYSDAAAVPETRPDDASHRMDLILSITEGQHKQ